MERDLVKKLNVLIVGSGGREHALSRAILASPLLSRLWVAPGNAGTAGHNIDLDASNHDEVVAFCRSQEVDLVVVGPEVPLVAGLADDLVAAGIRCLGPSRAAARLEGSKSFARDFAARHGIPGPQSAPFGTVGPAIDWIDEFPGPVVVKADGLAAGKGVIVPETRVETERAIYDFLSARTLGEAGATVLLEERLEGEELSLFGLADGKQVILLGSAQDHKRVGEGDTGPNTGGMGAFAPVPGKAALEDELAKQFLQPVVDGMIDDGTPYVGVIYAGIMLTEDGPKLIEYNCRFGDPEAQVLLPLIKSDVLDLLDAAASGRLEETRFERVTGQSAVTVVVAARGYPASPALDVEIPEVTCPPGVSVIHAGTRILDDGAVVSSGGRVLSVTGTGTDLADALTRVYQVVSQLVGEQLFARRDIGWRYVPRDAYARAGVSLTTAAEVNQRIVESVRSTHDSRVLAGLGSFGGVFDLSAIVQMDEPVLVASTDGVGTKTLLADQLDSWESIGVDIVNHGINDVLVQGARPLFFLDTVAASSLNTEIVGRIVDGMAAACRTAGCVLLGGETAEMPDVLASGAVDVSGTMVGAVERARLLPKPSIAPGHRLVGIRSSGLHTNGYSLARKVFSGTDLDEVLPYGPDEFGAGPHDRTIGEALVAPHRSYLAPLARALDSGLLAGLAHITGGGLIDNIPRVLPEGCGAVIDTKAWTWPPLFERIVALGGLNRVEAHQVLNLGIGMVAVVAPDDIAEVQRLIPEPTMVIGRVVSGRDVALS
jgi:phosphoribosylamine--glycine ligase/phosphoribosylformylglycinamidine cyclo-ligase